MKAATLDQEQIDLALQEPDKGSIKLGSRQDYSAKMITRLIHLQHPVGCPSLRNVQRAIAALQLLDLSAYPELNQALNQPTYAGNAPYFDRIAAIAIISKLKYRVVE